MQAKYPLSPGPGDLVVDRILTAASRGVLRPGVWQSEPRGSPVAPLDLACSRSCINLPVLRPSILVLALPGHHRRPRCVGRSSRYLFKQSLGEFQVPECPHFAFAIENNRFGYKS